MKISEKKILLVGKDEMAELIRALTDRQNKLSDKAEDLGHRIKEFRLSETETDERIANLRHEQERYKKRLGITNRLYRQVKILRDVPQYIEGEIE